MFPRWPAICIAFLLLAPVLVFVGFGGWALFQAGHLWWMWVTVPVSWGIAWVLIKLFWNRVSIIESPPFEQPRRWTERDKQAWEIVKARIALGKETDQTEMTRLDYWLDEAKTVSKQIAEFYKPDADEPFDPLTIPEILAAVQLALEDIAERYDEYVPGGHLLTIGNFKTMATLPEKYKKISNVWTGLRAALNPAAAIGRFITDRTVGSSISSWMKGRVVDWFHRQYLERVGYYVIEMYSGRLRGGKAKFVASFGKIDRLNDRPWEEQPEIPKDESPVEEPDSDDPSIPESSIAGPMTEAITICIVGQSGSGRTSIVQALIKDLPDETTRMPKAETVVMHRLRLPESAEDLRLLETVGYSNYEESKSIRKDRLRAIAESDLLLVVMNVADPARDADVRFLEETAAWFSEKPHLKPPAAIAVLTHIDLLKPPMKWAPPYNWREPSEMKEQSIHDAVEHVREELAGRVVDVVPVCADTENERVFGITEWLKPAIAAALENARTVSTVRHHHDDLGKGGVSRVLQQVWNIGKAFRGN